MPACDDSDDMHECELCGGPCPNESYWYHECICDQCALDDGGEMLARMSAYYDRLSKATRIALYLDIQRWEMEMHDA